MPDALLPIIVLSAYLLGFVVIGYGIYWIVRRAIRAELDDRDRRPPPRG